MQQGSNHRLRIHTPFGQCSGNRQWMGNVGLARIALLAAVRSFGKDIGLTDEGYFVRLEIAETVDENAKGRLFMRREFRLGSRRGTARIP